LRATRIVKLNFTRFVTLASSRQGSITPALRIVIALLKEIASELSTSGVYDGLSKQGTDPQAQKSTATVLHTKKSPAKRSQKAPNRPR
jgi:hypothetical protein